MKKFWNSVKYIGGLILLLGVALVALVSFAIWVESMETNHKEQAYVQGQHDMLNGSIRYTQLIANPNSETDKEIKTAYAEGLEDAARGDIRVKALTDSTYVAIKPLWDNSKELPKETFKVKL